MLEKRKVKVMYPDQLDLYCATPVCLWRQFSFCKSFGHLMQSLCYFSAIFLTNSSVPFFLSLKSIDQLDFENTHKKIQNNNKTTNTRVFSFYNECCLMQYSCTKNGQEKAWWSSKGWCLQSALFSSLLHCVVN